jgi:hypothetical protein
MTSVWCPQCGAEYVAGVQECADCLVPLVDTKPLTPEEVGDDGGDQLAYELEDYDPDARVLLDGMLTTAAIRHAWQGSTLVVRAIDEAQVDELVAHLDQEEDEPAGLDPDAEQVVYEVSDWSEDQKAELEAALRQEGLPYEWDENGDLAVLEADEARVEAMLDAIEFPDSLPVLDEGEDLDGDGIGDTGQDDDVVQDTLSGLFVAADRLMHDAEDAEGVIAMVDAARQAESLPVPYGFSPPVWADIAAQAASLRSMLEDDSEQSVGDDVIMDHARALRNVLRQYV